MDRNTKSRLRTVSKHLDKALDALHRAKGEMYPAQLAHIRGPVVNSMEHSIDHLLDAAHAIKTVLVDPPKEDLPDADGESWFEDGTPYTPENIEARRQANRVAFIARRGTSPTLDDLLDRDRLLNDDIEEENARG